MSSVLGRAPRTIAVGRRALAGARLLREDDGVRPTREPAEELPQAMPIGLGWLPWLALSTAVGLALISLGYAQSRTGADHAAPLFYGGLLAVFVPIMVRLTAATASRGERIASVVLLGLALYAAKVLHDPFAFAFADEPVHQHNANEILRTGELFGFNTVLPVTPRYPGLEVATAALSALTGLSTFGAGLAVVGVARGLLMLSFFLVVERVTGSSRIAGLTTALYVGNPPYLFFSAQYSYESLALPLVLFILWAVLMWQRAARGWAPHTTWAWSAVILTMIVAVVTTHHMSSYALVGLLFAVCLLSGLPWTRRTATPRPWRFALAAGVATVTWLGIIARDTVGYLGPVLTGAVESAIGAVTGAGATRQLFRGTTGYQPPFLERLVGLAAVIIVVLALPFGLRALWRRFRQEPVALLLACAALGYLGTLAARVVPAAWETAARAGGHLWPGVAFVVALAAIGLADRVRILALGRIAVVVGAATVFMGGVIAGTSPTVRLPQTYRVDVGSQAIDPEGVASASWSREALGSNFGVVAEEAGGREMLLLARQRAYLGPRPAWVRILHAPKLEDWHVALLRQWNIRYVAVDRRVIADDELAGYFFRPAGDPEFSKARSPRVVRKLDRVPGVQRIWHSGDVAIYDVGRLRR